MARGRPLGPMPGRLKPAFDGLPAPCRHSVKCLHQDNAQKGDAMKFGIFYEHQLPRPWTARGEFELLQREVGAQVTPVSPLKPRHCPVESSARR